MNTEFSDTLAESSFTGQNLICELNTRVFHHLWWSSSEKKYHERHSILKKNDIQGKKNKLSKKENTFSKKKESTVSPATPIKPRPAVAAPAPRAVPSPAPGAAGVPSGAPRTGCWSRWSAGIARSSWGLGTAWACGPVAWCCFDDWDGPKMVDVFLLRGCLGFS